jgi:hypothetical protein
VGEQVNALGLFDAVIHNAAVGYQEGHRMTRDGLPHVFAINTLAPYILTALIEKPKPLVYLSSGMHERDDADLNDILWRKRAWMTPGWVPTKMGGAGAPDHIHQAHLTQVWLATSDDHAGEDDRRLFLSPEAARAEP